MKRVIWLVMDSFGIGNADDAQRFGDSGSDTMGNINKLYKLNIPTMTSLGLKKAYDNNNNSDIQLANQNIPTIKEAFWGTAKETSVGKDTLSGHWEMAGVKMDIDMHYFEDTCPTFPPEMIDEIISKSDIEGIIGDRHASGIEVISTLGAEHIQSGKPIFYTSADSVVQIAAHEESFGLDRLYKLCEITREVTDKYGVGRVIARPFVGNEADGFERTKNRRDYALRPSGKSVLEIATENDLDVIGIGKIHDIFGGFGVSKKVPAYKLDGLMDATLNQMNELQNDGIIYTNFVDFDMEWGHRRDTKGYANGLEYFDSRLHEVIDSLQENDLLIITADHGCDPTFKGTDHTRENVPVFGVYKGASLGNIGTRETFGDMGAAIAQHLEINAPELGVSFID